MRRRITTSGNSAALVLSQDILGLMQVGIGDEVDVSLVDRTLVVRPMSEADRGERARGAFASVLERRGELFRRLAEGSPNSRPATKAKPRRARPRR